MLGPKRRALLYLTLALIAVGGAGDLILLTARGSQAPGWAHWWCSASGLKSAAGHGGQAPGGFTATLLSSLRAMAPHWPHILPIVVALATLVYLRRADARYHAHQAQVQVHG